MVFDFGKFAGDALRAVDRIRSLTANPEIKENPAEPIESRINAFYRALGLPAISSDVNKFPMNNGNLHKLKMSNDRKLQFVARENARNVAIDTNIVNSFLDGEKHDLSILDGITFVVGRDNMQSPKRKRGSLFPMYVYGDVGIFPQNRRVAGPFYTTKQIIIDGKRYERPLLELIILLRLRGFGVQDSTFQQALNDEFGKSLGEDFISTDSLNIITFEILKGLLETFIEIKDVVRTTVQKLGYIRTQIRSVYKDIKENVPDQQPILQSSDNMGSLEKLSEQQKAEQAKKNAILTLLEYDDTISNGEQVTRNMKSAWMAHSILDLLTTESQRIDISIKETKKQNEKLKKLNKEQQRQMDLLLGTFSGLSGIDIVVIIVALFTVDEQYLLGLLNEAAFGRLKEIKGKGFNPSRADVSESVDQLEKKVVEIYEKLSDSVNIQNLLESNQSKTGGA